MFWPGGPPPGLEDRRAYAALFSAIPLRPATGWLTGGHIQEPMAKQPAGAKRREQTLH